MRLKYGRRMVWLGLVMLLLFGAMGGRVYQLQVVKGGTYAKEAYHQRTSSLILNGRGMILDRNGLPLSDPQPGWGIAVFPKLMVNPQGVRKAVATLLKVPLANVALPVEPKWIATGVTAKQAAAVRQWGLTGVVAAPITARIGPDSLARHLVGYFNETGGLLGLEKALNPLLVGDKTPTLVSHLDGRGAPLQESAIQLVMPKVGKEPDDVYTTIDGRIQGAVERVLDSHGHPDGGPLRGAVVVMDPHTGDVLAMASRPQWNQAVAPAGQPYGEYHFLMNRAVSSFDPGSIFKTIVAAAALEGGFVKLDEKFYCSGHYTLGDQTFHDIGGTAHGWLTFQEAIARSCNITFAKVGYERLGATRLAEAARQFGFGQETGTGLLEEQDGQIPDLAYGGQVVQLSFGQGGIMTSPLQMARAYSAIANGGILPPVQLIKAIKNPAGVVVKRPPAGKAVRVISEGTAKALRAALVTVTNPSGTGTGRQAWVPGGGSAGKTGTAQGRENGKPVDHAWFAGYLPAAEPKYVIVALIEGGRSGGGVAAPLFREVGQAILALPAAS